MTDGTKKCPYCGEEILAKAIKCKHCGEFIEKTISNRKNCISNDDIPSNIKQWNWGAFLLNWIWGIGNKSYLALLALIPYFGFIWAFVCGFKGNEWAWQNKQWSSVEDFQNTQKKWALIGGWVIGSLLIIMFMLFIVCALAALNT